MDEVDQAQGHNQDFQDFALQLQQMSREPANYTGTDCLECGDEIPEKSRLAVTGCTRCIECQIQFETRRPL